MAKGRGAGDPSGGKGRVLPEFEQAFLREIVYPPFRIVYRRDPSRVRIVRVWRSETPRVMTGDR